VLGRRFITSPNHPRRALETNGYQEISSPKIKWLGCKSDRSPLSSAEIKNMRNYFSTSSYVFMARRKTVLLQSKYYIKIRKGKANP
jgi:hypothetical protein